MGGDAPSRSLVGGPIVVDVRILVDTDDELVIRHRPWFLAALSNLLALGVGFSTFINDSESLAIKTFVAALVAGILGASWHWFPFTISRFSRVDETFEHQERRITGERKKTVPLSQITEALVETDAGRPGGLSRAVLKLEEGSFALEAGYGTQDRIHIRDAINDWLGVNQS